MIELQGAATTSAWCPTNSTRNGLHCRDPRCGGVDPSLCCPRTCGGPEACESSDISRAFGVLATAFVVIPILLSIPVVIKILRTGLLREDQWKTHKPFFLVLSCLSLTNLEYLKVLPWKSKQYDGFPRQWMLGASFMTTVVEDIPQLIIQALFIFVVMPQFGERPLSNPIPLLSLFSTVISIFWRCFRKMILLLFSPEAELTRSDSSADEFSSALRRAATMITARRGTEFDLSGRRSAGDRWSEERVSLPRELRRSRTAVEAGFTPPPAFPEPPAEE